MDIKVGSVVSVSGTSITIKMDDSYNQSTIFYRGERFKGISIREHVLIRRGFKEIACIVEGEYLNEKDYEMRDEETLYIRKVEVKPLGYFSGQEFYDGIKHLPMIGDEALLISESKLAQIYSTDESGLEVGVLVKEGVRVSLPWQRFFNSHLAIFGNTGSGKSNTLTALYCKLFEQRIGSIVGKSKFVIIDFNGEYTGEQFVAAQYKSVYELSTRTRAGNDKVPISSKQFWELEKLSILFQAKPNTQRPFLNRVLKSRAKYIDNPDSLSDFFKFTLKLCFTSASQKPECLDLLRELKDYFADDHVLFSELDKIAWHGGRQCFHYPPLYPHFFNADGENFDTVFNQGLLNQIDLNRLCSFEELIVRTKLTLIGDLCRNYVQFDHIQPLLKRVESALYDLKKVLTVTDDIELEKTVNVISLRDCNLDIKKVVPLLIAKGCYEDQKSDVANPPDKTLHLIIDEAHNILSSLKNGEQDSWKDYRLDTFEEIIKEGRKFGVFLTISSQRPSDISSTIVSQVHNFFIHRLVNDRDLFLIDNTVSTLDRISRSLIPLLGRGCCIVTGNAFSLPMTIQFDLLSDNSQPDSNDVKLEELWE